MHLQHPARHSRGFTLIELMIVVVIATILLSIAIPSYQQQIRQSRRTEAKTAILDLASREERFLSTNPTGYTVVAANLGYGALPTVIGSGYYTVSVCSPACAPSAAAAPSYTVIATPVAGTSQAQDTQCTAFAVDSAGQQYAADGTGAYTAAAQQFCWTN
ncbi:MAG TPA: type IV pilin protein [Steroidobacteraceae bacterium]|jgi:type IV pilus assembly protein PilE|nr:type IV pilin protein [Steroidobacteraceae bacterium]